MGFLSFNEKYYADALRRLESGALDEDGIYQAKQLLKVLDDLLDEGYTELNAVLEEKHQAVSRLRRLLDAHQETPFPVQRGLPAAPAYGGAEMDVEGVCQRLAAWADRALAPADGAFLAELRGYCAWIGRRPGTAYVFLLRDAFLPYLYFRRGGGDGLYPWVINRDFLRQTAGEGADDILRRPVYEALEAGISDFETFSGFCKERIRRALRGCPALEDALRGLLGGVREKRILVIESGYCGTIPLTLSALDERVDLRLYTTAPYLYGIYRDRIFCRRYERLRSFETLYAQDRLMKYARLRDGRFYVRTAREDEDWARAAGEARCVGYPPR